MEGRDLASIYKSQDKPHDTSRLEAGKSGSNQNSGKKCEYFEFKGQLSVIKKEDN